MNYKSAPYIFLNKDTVTPHVPVDNSMPVQKLQKLNRADTVKCCFFRC